MDSNALYEKDFYVWIQYHIELLKQGKLEQSESFYHFDSAFIEMAILTASM
jgi:hypothetical protein